MTELETIITICQMSADPNAGTYVGARAGAYDLLIDIKRGPGFARRMRQDADKRREAQRLADIALFERFAANIAAADERLSAADDAPVACPTCDRLAKYGTKCRTHGSIDEFAAAVALRDPGA